MKDKDFKTATKKLRQTADEKSLKRVGRIGTRTSAMTWFITTMVGMLAVGGAYTLADDIKTFGVKDTIKDVASPNNALNMMLVLFFLAIMMSYIANESESARKKYVADVLSAAGLNVKNDAQIERAFAVYGLILNHMTDAEYRHLLKLMDKWTIIKSDLDGHNYTSKNIQLVASIVNGVLERNVGLREMLADVIQGKPVAMLEFTKKGAAVVEPVAMARKKMKDATK